MELEYRSTRRKTSRNKEESQQQTHPAYDDDVWSWTRVTLVGGDCSHYCAIPCFQDTEWRKEKDGFISVKMCFHPAILIQLDRKRVRIFAYWSTREQSNKRSGARLKTESETGEQGVFIRPAGECEARELRATLYRFWGEKNLTVLRGPCHGWLVYFLLSNPNYASSPFSLWNLRNCLRMTKHSNVSY